MSNYDDNNVRDKEQEKADKRAQKQWDKQVKDEAREAKSIRKAEKQEKTRLRHDEGKYYFWEYNKLNFSKFKIIEVEFFFWTTLILSINFILSAAFSTSNTNKVFSDLMFAIPSVMFVFMFINRFVESLFSNVRNRNVSLMSQRLVGIMYILIMFLYAIILVIILQNGDGSSGSVAHIDHKPWIIINIIVSFVMVILKSLTVSTYGTARSPKEW